MIPTYTGKRNQKFVQNRIQTSKSVNSTMLVISVVNKISADKCKFTSYTEIQFIDVNIN